MGSHRSLQRGGWRHGGSTGRLGRRHCGGRSRNANGNIREQAVFATEGQAYLVHTLELFERMDEVVEIALVVGAQDVAAV